MSFPFTEMFEVWCGMKGLDIKAHQVEGIDWVMERELNPSVGPAGGFIVTRWDWVKLYSLSLQ